MSDVGVRRAKAALSSGCKPHPAIAPAGSNRSSHGGIEVAGAIRRRCAMSINANWGGLPLQPQRNGYPDQDNGEHKQHPVLSRNAENRNMSHQPVVHRSPHEMPSYNRALMPYFHEGLKQASTAARACSANKVAGFRSSILLWQNRSLAATFEGEFSDCHTLLRQARAWRASSPLRLLSTGFGYLNFLVRSCREPFGGDQNASICLISKQSEQLRLFLVGFFKC